MQNCPECKGLKARHECKLNFVSIGIHGNLLELVLNTVYSGLGGDNDLKGGEGIWGWPMLIFCDPPIFILHPPHPVGEPLKCKCAKH